MRTDKRSGSVVAVAFAAALLALPAAAEVFTVTLTNGSTFDSRYRPKQSPGDDSRLLLMTEFGNWIALPTDQVAGIVSETESKGFGTVLDTTTIAIGWAPNDAAAPDDRPPTADSATRLLNYLEARDSAPPFSVEQFVEPNSAGGIPLNMTRTTTPPLGTASGEPVVAGDF